MTRNNYWVERTKNAGRYEDKSYYELESELRQLYRDYYKDLRKEISDFYIRYGIQNNLTLAEVKKRLNPKELKSHKEALKEYYDTVNRLAKKNGYIEAELLRKYKDEIRLLSARSYMSRLEALKSDLKYKIIRLGFDEYNIITKSLSRFYAKVFYKTQYSTDKGRGFSTGPGDLKTQSALKEKWLGENYSSRIWTNKESLVTQLETTVKRGLAQKLNPNDIAQNLEERMHVGYENCRRLAITEMTHMSTMASYDSYKATGVDKYKFMCNLREKTCEVCGELDGTVYRLEDMEEGITAPPIHPNCACYTEAYYEPVEGEDWGEGTRIARDENGKNIRVSESMTFEEWKKLYKIKETD